MSERLQKIRYVVVCIRLNKELSNCFKTEGISFPLYDSEHPCEILSHLLTYTVVLPYPQGIPFQDPQWMPETTQLPQCSLLYIHTCGQV